jgi:acyl carrier protein
MSPMNGTSGVDRIRLGLFEEIAVMVERAIRDDSERPPVITPNARLDADLGMESVEVVELSESLRARFGDRVDLPAFAASLDIDSLIGLTVGQVTDYVAGALEAGHAETAGTAGPSETAGLAGTAMPTGTAGEPGGGG